MSGEPQVELDRRAAIARAIELAEPGDVVVIAGKGHERGQEIAGRHRPVRRPRGRGRGTARAAGDRVIQLTLDEVAELAPGQLQVAPGASG